MSRRGSDPDADPDTVAQLTSAARGAARIAHRSRLGVIGSEPYEARRPVARCYVATYGTLGALLLILANQIHIGVAIAVATLIIGVPKPWTWANDRIGAGLWVLGALLVTAGEVTWQAGGHAARVSLASKGHAGAADLLAGAGALVILVGFFRRWGTAGNVFYTSRQLDKGDPEAEAITAEAARREGYGRDTAQVSDETAARALDDAYRADHPDR